MQYLSPQGKLYRFSPEDKKNGVTPQDLQKSHLKSW
jgi:hypothetical protein